MLSWGKFYTLWTVMSSDGDARSLSSASSAFFTPAHGAQRMRRSSRGAIVTAYNQAPSGLRGHPGTQDSTGPRTGSPNRAPGEMAAGASAEMRLGGDLFIDIRTGSCPIAVTAASLQVPTVHRAWHGHHHSFQSRDESSHFADSRLRLREATALQPQRGGADVQAPTHLHSCENSAEIWLLTHSKDVDIQALEDATSNMGIILGLAICH